MSPDACGHGAACSILASVHELLEPTVVSGFDRRADLVTIVGKRDHSSHPSVRRRVSAKLSRSSQHSANSRIQSRVDIWHTSLPGTTL